ncbi:hypothetical protein D3C81_1955700 [compost metagenome]
MTLVFDQCPQALQVLRAGSLSGQPQQRDLGQPTGVQCLPGLLGIRLGDAGTMVGAQEDDVLMGQSPQHLPHVAAPCTEHLRKAFFRKATGRMDALLENGLEDP